MRKERNQGRMVLIQILLISGDLWDSVCVYLDPQGPPFWEGKLGLFLFTPLSYRTSKAMAVILSFVTRSFVLICKGTPDNPPHSLFESPHSPHHFWSARGVNAV